MSIYDFTKQIEIKEDFIKFLSMLEKDFKEDNENWDNQELKDYLGGLYGFTLGIDGYYQNSKQNVDSSIPTWKLFADILLAAKVHS